MGQTLKEKTTSGLKWSAVERISVQGLQFAINIFTARLLTPSDYGIIAMTGIFFTFSQSLVDSGFGNALVRKLDCDQRDYSTVFFFNIIVGIALTLLLYTVAPLIAQFFRQPLLTDIVRALSFTLLFNSLLTVQFAKLTREVDFKKLALINFATSLISGIVGITMAYKGYGVWVLATSLILQSFLRMVFSWLVVRWRPSATFSWTSFKEMYSYGCKLMFSGWLHSLYTEMSGVFIGRFYTSSALGNFNRGSSLSQTPAHVFNGIMQRVSFPILSKLQNDNAQLISVYRKFIAINSMVMFFLCLLLAVLARPVVLILLGENWINAIPYLQVFCFSVMTNHLCSFNLTLLQVKGRSDLFLRLEIIKKAISISMLIASVPFGPMAMCITTVVYDQISVYIDSYYTHKLYGLPFLTQLSDCMPYLVYSVVACIPAFVLSFILDNVYLLMIMGGTITVALYITILYFRKDEVFMKYLYPYLKQYISIVTKAMNFSWQVKG